jgi:hypothetical protein
MLAISLNSCQICRRFDRHPNCLVAALSWRAKTANRSSKEDMAHLARPKVVFRHESETLEVSEVALHLDTPACFFPAFPMQGSQRAFARIERATRKLDFPFRAGLHCHQNIAAAQDHGIGSWTSSVVPFRLCGFAKASHGRHSYGWQRLERYPYLHQTPRLPKSEVL